MEGSQAPAAAKPAAPPHKPAPPGPEAEILEGDAGPAPETAELDLDRLVWDPEYRRAMQALIKRGD